MWRCDLLGLVTAGRLRRWRAAGDHQQRAVEATSVAGIPARRCRRWTTNPDGFFDFVAPSLSEPDQKRWSEPDVRTAALTMFREAFRQGVDAYVQDHLINQSSWSDLLPRVTQPVGLWQGDTDHNVPLAATQYLAGLMRHGQLTVLPATGHIISTDHWRALYRQLLTAAAP